MSIRIEILDEPDLIFEGDRHGKDPRKVLGTKAQSDNRKEKVISLGLVCLPNEVSKVKNWFSRLDSLLAGEEQNSLRFREFPGSRRALNCTFELRDEYIREIDQRLYENLLTRSPFQRFEPLLELYKNSVASLCSDERPDVILVCLNDEEGNLTVENPKLSPQEREILRRLKRDDDDQLSLFAPEPEEIARFMELQPQAEELLYRSFYRALKAKCMQLKNPVPIQVLRQRTYADSSEQQSLQSEGTRAWNLSVSLFYKAGNTPWRPSDLQENTCFVGISFHHLKRREGDLIYASVAQAFSNEVEPFVLRGASIPSSKLTRRQPNLSEEQARTLMDKVVQAYQERAGFKPSRVVIHKTSKYSHGESLGFRAALSNVSKAELVWMAPTNFRLVRKAKEEAWRGTLCRIGDDENYLFTTGYVPYWKEYPGPHIPAPLQIGSDYPTDIKERAKEILTLTKMNWNSSDGLGRNPVTISFAKRVGIMMTELDPNEEPNPSYRFYM